MAKRSILGVIRGKIGNMVGQSNSLSNGKDKQVWRAYNGTVANPKTQKQSMQRALFVAAKNFQTAFEGILNHSWQGVEYGPKSLNFFRKQVLTAGGANYNTFAYQAKGTMTAIPQPWPVSKGSITVQGINNIALDRGRYFSLNGGEEYASGNTLAELMPGLKVGDQITLLGLKGQYSITDSAGNPMSASVFVGQNYIPVVGRFLVDDTAVGDNPVRFAFTDETGASIGYALTVTQDDLISITTDDADPQLLDLAAVALIVSRKVEDKASWQRSTAVMFVPDFITAAFNTADYVQACIASFQNAAGNQESDWYLNESTDSTTTANPGYIEAKTLQTAGIATDPETMTNAAVIVREGPNHDTTMLEPNDVLFDASDRKYYVFTAPNVLKKTATAISQDAYDDGIAGGYRFAEINEQMQVELQRLGYIFE